LIGNSRPAVQGDRAWQYIQISPTGHDSLEDLAMQRDLESAATLLDKGQMTKPDLAALRTFGKPHGNAVLFVGSKQRPSTPDASELTFQTGHARGAVYMYSYDARQIICAGEIDVTSSEQVIISDRCGGIGGGCQDKLEDIARDFEDQILRAIAGSLHATR
jgi:hypothetical protein